MGRDFYDGVDASRLPAAAWGVGGYVDGLYKWSAADWARFPHAVKARIAVFADTDDGHILDVEQGNATPAQSVDWVLMRRRAGVDPTVYMNTSTWPLVRGAFRARGVAEPHYWVAQYDGVASIPAGAVAKQYYNNDALGYDLSIVADHWPGIDPAPSPAHQTPTPEPPPASVPTQDTDMTHFNLDPGAKTVFTNPGAVTLRTAQLLIAGDFGDAVVRVALFDIKSGWSVATHPVGRVAGALKIPLPPNINKVSLSLESGPGIVGADVLA